MAFCREIRTDFRAPAFFFVAIADSVILDADIKLTANKERMSMLPSRERWEL